MAGENSWKLRQIRSAAKLAVELGVSIELRPDGSIVVAPSAGAPPKPLSALEKWKAEQEQRKREKPENLPRLNQRQTSALKQLVEHDGKRAANLMSGCGPSTLEGLRVCGAIEVRPPGKEGGPVMIHLTELGRRAWGSTQ